MKSDLSVQYAHKTILVTGGCGFLASNVILALKDVDCTILRLTRPGKEIGKKTGSCKIVDIQGELQTPNIWEETLSNVDIVYHFAAQTSTYVANANPEKDFQANVLPMIQLLETCKNKNWCPIVCFAGSVTEVGVPKAIPVDEVHPDSPVTIYDLHKHMAENYLKYYVKLKVVKGVTLRLPNIYGPGPKSSSADRGVLNMMMRRALKGEHLTVYGTGEQLRDYLHVDDAVRAFLLAPVYLNKINGEHIVLGTGEGHSIVQAMHLIADRVKQKVGKSVSITHIEPPTHPSPIESRNFVANSQNFFKATGWSPSYSLKEGIDGTLNYYLDEDKDSN